MKGRVYIILKEDIIFYPPVLSIINVLVDLGYKVYHVGVYSDEKQKNILANKGVVFISTVIYDIKGNSLKKFYQQCLFRKQVKTFLEMQQLTNNDLVWMMQAETVLLLHSIIDKYRTVLLLFEYVEPSINWKYRLFAPTFKMKIALHKAEKVVCCEYNRAQITKGQFQLEQTPYVLPNKPYVEDNNWEYIPNDVMQIVNETSKKVKGKKVVLYQGVFTEGERRIDEFCQAIQLLPDDYAFIAMGRGNRDYYDKLKAKYESERVIFVPFIRPPYHMLVTQLASVGILSYFPNSKNMASVINPIYCAPNKIFEYAKYGMPMISNDIPGLYYIFLEFHCGECIPYPMSPDNIRNTILKIFSNYDDYSHGALCYYNSVDLRKIICSIMEDKI